MKINFTQKCCRIFQDRSSFASDRGKPFYLASLRMGNPRFLQVISGNGLPEMRHSKMALVPSTSLKLWGDSKNTGGWGSTGEGTFSSSIGTWLATSGRSSTSICSYWDGDGAEIK